MSTNEKSSRPNNDLDIKQMVVLWAVCCMSPIMYLAASALIKKYVMDGGGYYPFSPSAWKIALICLGTWVLILQSVHVFIRVRFYKKLALQAGNTSAFLQLLKKRTFTLVAISEMAVFAGFCLFLLQGDLIPVFGAGIASMILYAQSHPRSGIPSTI